jgi:hypothetical protein
VRRLFLPLLRNGLLALGGLHRFVLIFLVALIVEAVQRPLLLDLLGNLTVGQYGHLFSTILGRSQLLIGRRFELQPSHLALLPLGGRRHVPDRDVEVDVVVRAGVVHHVVSTVVDLVVIRDVVHLLDDI